MSANKARRKLKQEKVIVDARQPVSGRLPVDYQLPLTGEKRKVWFILESASLTGGVRVIYDQCNLLARHGWDVTIMSLDQKPQWYTLLPAVKFEQQPNYEDIIAAMRYEGPRTLKVATWNGTAPKVRDGCEGNEGVYLVQDVEVEYFIHAGQRQGVLDTYNLGLSMYTPSRYVDSWMSEHGKECTYTGLWLPKKDFVYNNVDRYTFFPPMVLSVLRRQSLKGYQLLAEFSRRLWSLTQNVKLFTYSTDSGTKMAPNHAHWSSPSDKEVRKMYAVARCFTYASLQEGFGMSLAEAMLSGIPVVCTNSKGNTFCEDNVTALVVEQGPDAAQELTEKTLRVLQDAELSRYLATNARKVIEAIVDYKTVSSRVLRYFDSRYDQLN